jgi:hypothetical protein
MEQNSALRKLLGRLNKGLLTILKPLQIVNNFIFLAVAYYVGVGFSAILYRLGPGKKTNLKSGPVDSYWRKMPPAPRDRASWQRPF